MRDELVLPDGRLLASDAARYLGVAAGTLAALRRAGSGPPFVKAGKVFYFKQDLDNWLAARKVGNTREGNALPPIAAGRGKRGAREE